MCDQKFANDRRLFAGLWFGCFALCFLLSIVAVGCVGNTNNETKSRVPTTQYELAQAQQAARDAKASADKAEQTRKDVQADLDNLGKKNEETKIGHPEITGVGVVTEVGYITENSGSSTPSVFHFIFAEKAGFTKKFTPVCSEQTVPIGKTVVLNYHWNQDLKGCYQIDGYTVVQ